MTSKATFKISGMKCVSCAKVIKYVLEEEKGIGQVDVDFKLAQARMDFDPEKTNIQEIKNKISYLGYKAL